MISEIIFVVSISFPITFFVLLPLYNMVWFVWIMKHHGHKAVFSVYSNFHFDVTARGLPNSSSPISRVVGQIWLPNDRFLEWNMTWHGEIDIDDDNPIFGVSNKRRSLWWPNSTSRPKLVYFVPRAPALWVTGSPWLRHVARKSISTRGITGWAIRRYVGESFTMAKMAGFKEYRVEEYF